jgi:hypothetical protein
MPAMSATVRAANTAPYFPSRWSATQAHSSLPFRYTLSIAATVDGVCSPLRHRRASSRRYGSWVGSASRWLSPPPADTNLLRPSSAPSAGGTGSPPSAPPPERRGSTVSSQPFGHPKLTTSPR